MTKPLPILSLLALIAMVAVPAPRVQALTDEEVERKINQFKLYLYEQQDAQIGGWFGSYHAHPNKNDGKDGQDPEKNKNLGGPTAMATLALLVSGESSQDPRMAKAVDYLRTLDMYGTYALSVKVHVWSYLPDRYLDNLQRDAQILLGGADPNRSTWRYWCYPERDKSWDNSTNQYGILGMWQYSKRGGRLDRKFWENAAKHFLEDQSDNGGWGYTANGERLTMTCAGLTCLAVVQQEIFRDRNTPVENIQASINRGLGYMDKNFKVGEGAHGGGGYYRYGVERVALALGTKYFKDQDWFESIGDHIVKGKGKSSVVNTSFDLMFLARGRVPVWVNKIKLSQAPWKNRPNDIYFLSRFISKLGEHEVNWQYVELDRPVLDFLPAPVAWMSSDEAANLTDAEKAGLKQYLDLGGMLIANQENSSSFEESIRELALELYPNYEWGEYSTEHPFGSLIFQIDGSRLPLQVLSNGSRPLIVIPDRDWGLTLQKETKLDKAIPGQIMTNIYATVSDRGNLPNRLVREFPADSKGRSGHPKVWVGMATFGEENKLGNPEPAAWTAVRNILGADAAVNIQWAPVSLADIGNGKMTVNDEEQTISVLHLAGADREGDYQLTEAEQAAIKQFVEGGGTIFVEGVGGQSEFAEVIAKQLSALFGVGVSRMSSVDPIVSGSAAGAGRSVSKATYRRYSVISGIKPRTRLGAINIDGRSAVVFSSEDVSQGALGIRHWGINGYAPETARQIMINMVLTAKR